MLDSGCREGWVRGDCSEVQFGFKVGVVGLSYDSSWV